MSSTDNLKTKFKSLAPHLNERLTRLWAAAEAIALGRGGIKQVSFATGLSPKTIRVGIKELNAESEILPPHVRFQKRIRAIGGGRKPLQDKDPTLIGDLEALIEPITRGDPESPLCWTCKSTSKLAQQLKEKGHSISARTVASLLDKLGYSLQSNFKRKEGSSHPDRDVQFHHIHDKRKKFSI